MHNFKRATRFVARNLNVLFCKICKKNKFKECLPHIKKNSVISKKKIKSKVILKLKDVHSQRQC